MDIKYIKLRTRYDIVIATIFTSTWLLLYFFVIQDTTKPIVLPMCTVLSIGMFFVTIIKTKIPVKQYIPINNLFVLLIMFLISILSIITSAFIVTKLNTYVDNRIEQDAVYAEIPMTIGIAKLSNALRLFPSMYIDQISQIDAGYETYNFIRGAIGALNSGTEVEYENYINEQVDQMQSHDQLFFINEIIKKSDISMPFVAIRALTANTFASIVLSIIGSIWLIEDTLLIKIFRKKEKENESSQI